MQKAALPWTINSSKQYRVAILGDLILDEYWEGDVSRISPEAPVPVNLVTQTILRPGGAANAALNIQKAGGQACLIGVYGADAAAADLRRVLEENQIECQHIIVDRERPTTRKTRISANRQQILRVDWEKVHPISAAVEQQLIDSLCNTSFDSLLISDYGKGGLTASFIKEAINIARSKGAKVVVDPKGFDYQKYQGAYVITPNRKEAAYALNVDQEQNVSREQLAQRLQKQFQLDNVLVTLGAEGMFLYGNETGLPTNGVYLPAQAREVFDVSGAGDTVAAIIALGLACKLALPESMLLANLGAAVVVGKWGTQPIEAHELLSAYAVHLSGDEAKPTSGSHHKITSIENLKTRIGANQARSRKIVFTNGCFDILHAGHVSYLEKARQLGDLLVVAVNSDRSVRELKGPSRPVVSAKHRKEMLAALSCVDYVIEFDDSTPLKVIKELLPNVLVKGADWDKSKIIGADEVEKAGGRVETIEFIHGLSTSDIVNRIKEERGV